ncbi:hypothetical protein Btru_004770 [Bulinus truncatus]|nr:hypothetical protein Btru_004770 [Bulinus truncatus]
MSVAMETKPSSSRKRKHNSSSEVAVSVTMENRLSSSRKKKQTAISEKVSIRKYTLRNKSLKDVTSGQSGLSSAPKLNRYGKHEMQISEGGEADLHEHLKGCKKNPDHKTFIPITQFAMNHLPDGLKDNDLLELIKVAAELTSKVDHNQVLYRSGPQSRSLQEWDNQSRSIQEWTTINIFTRVDHNQDLYKSGPESRSSQQRATIKIFTGMDNNQDLYRNGPQPRFLQEWTTTNIFKLMCFQPQFQFDYPWLIFILLDWIKVT